MILADIGRFWTVKDGCTPDEYEDASGFGPNELPAGHVVGRYITAAVADGASAGFLSGRWADHLVREFVAADRDVDFAGVVTSAASGWEAIVDEYVRDRERRDEPIRWYEEPGLRNGAYATVLVLRISTSEGDGDGSFDAWAVGDSCLVRIRADEPILGFPLDDPADFNRTPALLASRQDNREVLRTHLHHHCGDWRPGDVFHLVTDAPAQWLLGTEPDGRRRRMPKFGSPEDFANWVASRRAAGQMHNDDATLLRVELR